MLGVMEYVVYFLFISIVCHALYMNSQSLEYISYKDFMSFQCVLFINI